MIYVMGGPPNCGKGTQAKLFCRHHGCVHISGGDILRDEIKNKTELGLTIQAILDRGDLVEDALAFAAVQNKIENVPAGRAIVLDGYPRTVGQADLLDAFLRHTRQGLKVLWFNVSPEHLYDRMLNRYICSDCGEIYNKLTKNPTQEGLCDVCHGDHFELRVDDKEELMKVRLQNYEKQTLPLIDFYTQRGLLYNIDASQNMDKVTVQIENLLKGEAWQE